MASGDGLAIRVAVLEAELREARRLWPEKPTADPPRQRARWRAAWRKRVDALLATPPVPSDHGAALDVERLAKALNASVGQTGWLRSTPGDPVREWLVNAAIIAAEYARLTPSVPPKPPAVS